MKTFYLVKKTIFKQLLKKMRVRAFRGGTVFLQKGFLTIYFNINFRGDQLFMGHLIKGKLTPKLKRIKKKQKV